MPFSLCLLVLGLAALVAGRTPIPGPKGTRSEVLNPPPPPGTTVSPTCPLVLPKHPLACVRSPGYTLPDLAAAPPPFHALTIVGTSVDLLQALPYNEMITL